jgi:dTDP-4-dehydrorhamnose 3,5-epimerase
MHYQVMPHVEAKVVACSAGAIHDVIVDLRPDSPTHLRWFGVDLSAANHRMLYIPPLVAHGFLTLEDNTEVRYDIMGIHSPACARGVRFDDPLFGIAWPAAPVVISARDRGHPDHRP